MLRLLAVIAAAAARPENTTYFDVASSLWPPTTAAGRCLADRRRFRELATSASAGGLSLAPASVMNSREGLPPGALKRMMFD